MRRNSAPWAVPATISCGERTNFLTVRAATSYDATRNGAPALAAGPGVVQPPHDRRQQVGPVGSGHRTSPGGGIGRGLAPPEVGEDAGGRRKLVPLPGVQL